jgi:hypothetical protein
VKSSSGPVPIGGTNIHFFNNFTLYHSGQLIDPSIAYITNEYGIITPDLYIQQGNQIVWA